VPRKSRDGLYRRKRKDGSPGAWVLDVVISGRRYIRTFDRSLSRTLARENAAEARRKILAGESERTPSPTLREYATQWLEDVAGELEGKTLSRYKQDLEGHVLPALGRLRLDEIDTPTVKAFLRAKREGVSSRTGKHYAPDTIRLMRAALSSVLAEAVEDGLIVTNPCLYRGGRRRKAGTVSKADRHAAIRPMSFDERDRFLAEAHKTSLGVLFELLAKGGLRPSEAYALRIDDLDLRARSVRVERALELSTRKIKSTKTAVTRDVDLSPELVACLRDHVAAIRERAMRKGWGEPELLFPSRTNTLLDHNHVAKGFKRILKKASLPSFRPYDLRHTYASLLLAEGAPISYVAAQLGHAKPTTTLAHYAQWIPNEGKNYAALLDTGSRGKTGSESQRFSQHRKRRARKLAPRVGFEPTAYGLTVRRSTVELPGTKSPKL